jgi:hypothetical protein
MATKKSDDDGATTYPKPPPDPKPGEYTPGLVPEPWLKPAKGDRFHGTDDDFK